MLNQLKEMLCICVLFQESRDSTKEEPEANVCDIFYHTEEHFKAVYVCRYGHTIPETPNFDKNILLY